jgi:hypothetical protein
VSQCFDKLSAISAFPVDKGGPWLKIRYLVVFCGFLANAVGYMMRVNLSVAIVAMTVENGTSIEGPEDVPVSHLHPKSF